MLMNSLAVKIFKPGFMQVCPPIRFLH